MPPCNLIFKSFQKTISTPGTEEALTTEKIITPFFRVFGGKGGPAANNTGNVFVGNKEVDNKWIPIIPGAIREYRHGDGRLLGCESDIGFDLRRFFLDVVTASDGVIVEYLTTEDV